MESQTEPNLTESKHSYQPLFIVILIILTLFSTTTAIYLYWQSQQPTQSSSSQIIAIPTPIKTICPSIIPLSCPTPTTNPRESDHICLYPAYMKFYNFYTYLPIRLNKNHNDVGSLYTSSWFWCGGSKGERLSPSEYEGYLTPIGNLDNKNQTEVYSLSPNAPLPQDAHLLPLENPNPDSPQISDKDKWQQFLTNQETNGYPMVILKENGKNLIYIRVDYLYLPGC